MSTATEARDRAIDRVERNADTVWYAWALGSVRVLADTRATFTTDDVWAALDRSELAPTPHEPRAMGAVIRFATRELGIIAPTGEYVKSTRPECHARPIPVYRSTVLP